MKKYLLFAIVIVLLSLSFLYFRGNFSSSGNGSEGKMTLYVGATCPHCKNVEEWLKNNQSIEEKAGLVIKEVYYNPNNNKELLQRASECSIEKDKVFVPFLYDQGKCLVGDQPIIDYLGSKFK